MLKRNKRVFGIAVTAGLIGYTIVLSFLVEGFAQDTPAEADAFGALEVTVANGVVDPGDENENSLFANVDKRLLRRDQPELGDLKLITLYQAAILPGQTLDKAGQKVTLEIHPDHGADESLIVLQVGDVLKPVAHSVQTRSRRDGENREFPAVVFTVDEPGYYGLAARRREAGLVGLTVLLSLGAFVGLYVLLFRVIKPREAAE